MRPTLIAGNWKMNGSRELASNLMQACIQAKAHSPHTDIAVFPPYPLLPSCADQAASSGIMVGAQDLSSHASGAYTGEVSAAMLIESGASMVLIGHSERRQWHKEGPPELRAKLLQAIAHGLTPIYCVGESLQQRQNEQTDQIVAEQLAILGEPELRVSLDKIVLAYEPVWAIGTGLSATPTQAQAVHAHIRGLVADLDVRISGLMRILYGGSVTPETAAGLLSCEDIDGALVGGASLKADAFSAIVAAAP